MTEKSGRPQPYIGVSGVVSPRQQQQIEAIFETAADVLVKSNVNRRQLLLGVKSNPQNSILRCAK